MEVDPDAPSFGGRCKTFMNILRRVLSFREKRSNTLDEFHNSNSSIALEPTGKDRLPSLTSSDGASTSFSVISNAPSIYEDPFVAVTADGFIHVKYYFVFNPRIEFHMDDIHLPQMRKLSRMVDVRKISTVFYAAGYECKDELVCKSWGMCRNDVWWASHLNRMESGNIFTNIVIDDGSTIRPGFSVMNIEAFAESIQCVGLAKDVPFQHGIPSPPIGSLQIPFIDDEMREEEEEDSR